MEKAVIYLQLQCSGKDWFRLINNSEFVWCFLSFPWVGFAFVVPCKKQYYHHTYTVFFITKNRKWINSPNWVWSDLQRLLLTRGIGIHNEQQWKVFRYPESPMLIMITKIAPGTLLLIYFFAIFLLLKNGHLKEEKHFRPSNLKDKSCHVHINGKEWENKS